MNRGEKHQIIFLYKEAFGFFVLLLGSGRWELLRVALKGIKKILEFENLLAKEGNHGNFFLHPFLARIFFPKILALEQSSDLSIANTAMEIVRIYFTKDPNEGKSENMSNS